LDGQSRKENSLEIKLTPELANLFIKNLEFIEDCKGKNEDT
jgi:hypothetical protein